MKKILSLSAFLTIALLVSMACQTASTSSTDNGNKANKPANSVAPKADDHGHADDAPRINLADAKKDFDAGNVVFIDTRAKAAYDTEHITGAINMTTDAVEARYKEIPADKKIIAYCSWPAEHTSAGLVTKLKEKGIGNGYALVGGTNAWKTAGYPMEKSEQK